MSDLGVLGPVGELWRFVLVGHSLGAVVAMSYARNHPEIAELVPFARLALPTPAGQHCLTDS
jgi:pimeloyl-ACP methyl ester carboxylesterase